MHLPNSVRWLLVVLAMLSISSAASAGVFISVNFGPPPLPVYVQPVCPAPGYMWTPGYWAYGPEGYFWVPGTWVVAPQPGLLWTPGYWGFAAGLYGWHPGYWGPTIGFYGGVNYGFGYTGVGYAGGYWRDRQFYYNQNVNNVNVTNVHNVYNTTVINNNTTVNRVSYNGGPGGIVAQPTPAEAAAAREPHVQPTTAQMQHETMAQNNRQLLASVNHGKPAIAATAKAGEFNRGVVAASRAGAPYRAPQATNGARADASAPRPGNSSVPRPPSSYRETSSANNQNSSAPHTNVPRPPSSYRQSTEDRAENTPRPGTTNHAQNPPRPQGYSHTQQASKPPSEPNRQTVPRSQSQPRPEAAPQRDSQPRPEARPQGEPRGERPER